MGLFGQEPRGTHLLFFIGGERLSTSFFSNLLQVFIIGVFGIMAAISGSVALNYLQAHNIKSNVENYMLDMAAYGTKHNGFNDPSDASSNYTFDYVNSEMMRKHKLKDPSRGFNYLLSTKFEPAPGTPVGGERSQEISITVEYQYPTLNPFDDRDNMKKANTKKITDVVHGYVKDSERTDKLDQFDETKPWWEW